jgi:hypothetical protein
VSVVTPDNRLRRMTEAVAGPETNFTENHP